MKRIILILFLVIASNAKAQDKGFYNLDIKVVEITHISFKIWLPNFYYKNIKKELTGIILNKYRKHGKNVYYVKKHYNTDKDDESKNSLGEEIDAQVFNEIVDKLNGLNLEAIKYDANITDGSSYFLSFGGGSININLSGHTAGGENSSYPELKDFLDLFDYVFDKVKQE